MPGQCSHADGGETRPVIPQEAQELRNRAEMGRKRAQFLGILVFSVSVL